MKLNNTSEEIQKNVCSAANQFSKDMDLAKLAVSDQARKEANASNPSINYSQESENTRIHDTEPLVILQQRTGNFGEEKLARKSKDKKLLMPFNFK